MYDDVYDVYDVYDDDDLYDVYDENDLYDVYMCGYCAQDDYYSKYTHTTRNTLFLYTYVLSFYLLENKLGYSRLTKEIENNYSMSTVKSFFSL